VSHLFPERIETDRLELSAITTESVDVLEYYRILSGRAGDPMSEITEYLAWDSHEHPNETLTFVESAAQRRRDDRGTEYVIRPKAREDGAGEIAGAAGIGVDWDRRVANFGAWLRKRYWGRGYSGERAAAFVELAFEHLDLELVTVDHEVGNEKSRRAITKYVQAHGGREDGQFRNYHSFEGEGIDAVRYSIGREEYADSPGGSESAIVAASWADPE